MVFSYVVKVVKITITAKFHASRRLRFEDTKRIMSPEMRPKSFGTFEKRAPGYFFSVVSRKRSNGKFKNIRPLKFQFADINVPKVT